MSRARYPDITEESAAVLIRAEPGEKVSPELVTRALSASSQYKLEPESFARIRADFDRVHFIDDEGHLSPLADKYGHFLRQWLARQVRR